MKMGLNRHLAWRMIPNINLIRRTFKESILIRHRNRMDNIPDLKSFMRSTKRDENKIGSAQSLISEVQDPYSLDEDMSSSASVHALSELSGRRFFIETYGCQMNVSDTEIVHAVLEGAGLVAASSLEDASVVLVNTCAVRARRNASPPFHLLCGAKTRSCYLLCNDPLLL